MLQLTKEESKVFFEIVNSELKCVVNEYDDNTGRRPGKKRVKDSKYAENIIHKWQLTQKQIPGPHGLVNLDIIRACVLNLSNEEKRYSKQLLNKTANECRKELKNYPKPYTGVLKAIDDIAITADNINLKI